MILANLGWLSPIADYSTEDPFCAHLYRLLHLSHLPLPPPKPLLSRPRLGAEPGGAAADAAGPAGTSGSLLLGTSVVRSRGQKITPFGRRS